MMRESGEVELRWKLRMPTRDGVHLNGTAYLPAGRREPAPCVCAITPYISDNSHDRAMYFAARGTPFVLVDARGRGNSEGEFHPNVNEARDGHDVVEWLARQPYCNGKVAMWGGSYLGYCQWAVAKELPPHLATIVPRAAPFQGIDFPMRNNIFHPYIIQWLAYVKGRAAQPKLFADRAFWSSVYRTWHESGWPFANLDDALGDRSAVFDEWLDHPALDEYWDSLNPTDEQYARIQFPVLTITGSYDDDQPGALEHYRRHLRCAPEARERHYLVIGPWDHLRTGTPSVEFGGLTVGAASLVDIPRLHLEWYAWCMQGGPKPAFLQKRVAYYVMGAEQWRYADSLEEITERHDRYFLDSDPAVSDVFCSGALRDTCGRGGPDRYTYDPRLTRGPEVEAEANAVPDSLVDQSLTLALQDRQLIYHSAPFAADTEISGFFKLTAWIAIDCPDTDLYVSVWEIAEDGSCIRLSTDAVRARYREGLRSAKLIETREPLRYEFERLTFVSRQIKRGHRLRLVIAPLGRLAEGTFVQKNYNSGGVIASESVKEARAVTVSLFHDSARPSVLHVPIGRLDQGTR